MIKLENYEVMGWEHAIRGMRNPMNSWAKSDSKMIGQVLKGEEIAPGVDRSYWEPCVPFIDIGPNDHKLMMKLAKAGPVHGKFRRMITVYVDITAPLYWWKEFDTYKVGTVANSCSTMHKIHEKPFGVGDISCDELCKGNLKQADGELVAPELKAHYKHMMNILDSLNNLRDLYLKTGDKRYWRCMIEMLPSSYNQKRTVQLNYEVLANIYEYRKNHKLDEWREFCQWIEQLPYSEIILGYTFINDVGCTGEPGEAGPDIIVGDSNLWH
jgi:hypothetical protein